MESWKWLPLTVLLMGTLSWTSFAEESIEDILNDETHPRHVEVAWNYTEHQFAIMAEQMMKKIMPMVVRSSSSIEISGPCMASLFKLLLGARKQKLWAMRMIDAWGKPPGGMFSGNLGAVGDYDQCVNVEIPVIKDPDGNPQRGMYCLVTFTPKLPPKPQLYTLFHKIPDLKNISVGDTSFAESARNAHWFWLLALRIGVCMPNSCTPTDVSNILSEIPKQISLKGELLVRHCEEKQHFKVDNEQMAVLIVLGITSLMLFIGTTLDVIVTLHKGDDPEEPAITKKLLYRFFVCFSLYTNFRKLINTKTSENNIGAVNGVRFITVTWVIAGHSYLYADYNMMSQSMKVQTLPPNFAFQIIANAMLTVDTFILMSGMLVTYAVLKSQEKRKGLNIPMYIFHRFWRLTPPYMMTIALLIGTPIIGSGPLWKFHLDPLIQNCRANWWTNLLYVNNFVNTYEFCLEHTWYLGVDMQLHILGLLVLLPLLRWPKVAAVIGVLLAVGFSTVAGLVNIIFDLPPSPLGLFPDPADRIYVEVPNYFKPYGHVAPYFLGVLLGYIIVHKPNLRIPRPLRVIGWLFFTTLTLTVTYGAYTWNNGNPWTPTISALYGGTSKLCWALGIFWLLLVCCTGNGGVVNDILSWKAWIPLSRISFVFYLIHPLVIWTHEAAAHDRTYSSHYFWVYNIFGHFMTSIGVALIMSLAYEAPFLALEKIIFGTGSKDSEKSQTKANGKSAETHAYASEMKSRTFSKGNDGHNGMYKTGSESNNGIYRTSTDGLYRVAKDNGYRNGGVENGGFCRL